ncbi:hypothetical protein CVT26_014429 [Gymnopilus dilepis]|uniref:JmjC domain-containing protein n=1 Tax=Gymnopilus dilepis TaxID=231916 RepID=A0A409WS40_9AGAR|nr:hypothetical protein CVT26_014429 [Gymnopilus dilepis]
MEFECASSRASITSGKVKKIAFCPTESDVVLTASSSASKGAMLHLWSLSCSKFLQEIQLDSPVLDFQWSAVAMNSLILLTEAGAHQVFSYSLQLHRLSKRLQQCTIVHPESVVACRSGCLSTFGDLAVSAMGKDLRSRNWMKSIQGVYLFFSSHLRAYNLWLTDSPSILCELSIDAHITGLQLLNSNHLLICSWDGRMLLKYDMSSFSVLRTINLDYIPSVFAFCASQNSVVILSPKSELHVIDATTLDCSSEKRWALSTIRCLKPAFLAAAQEGNLVGIASEEDIEVYDLSSNIKTSWKTRLQCRRPYAISVSSNQVVVAYRPQDANKHNAWSIGSWRRSEQLLDELRSQPPTMFSEASSDSPSAAHNELFSQPHEKSPSQSSNKPTSKPHSARFIEPQRKLFSEQHTGSESTTAMDIRDNILVPVHEPHNALIGHVKIQVQCGSTEECRFDGFRVLGLPATGLMDLAAHFYSQTSGDIHLFRYREWIPPRTNQHTAVIKDVARVFLLPMLEAELLHLRKLGSKTRKFNIQYNTTCDICFRCVFFTVWFCRHCGLEICAQCFEACPVATNADSHKSPLAQTHYQNWLFPVSFFTEQEVILSIQSIKAHGIHCNAYLSLNNSPSSPLRRPSIERLPVQSMSDEKFAEMWAMKAPFVVSGVCTSEAPFEVMDLHNSGPHPCQIQTLHKSGTLITSSTLEEYFDSWHDDTDCPRQDYPTNGNLHDLHPTVAEKFYRLVEKIAPSFLSPRGPMNLASYWPNGSNVPDMGPKLYIAERDFVSEGTTHLHMDKSAAVNIMLHSSSSGKQSGARWEIWPQNSVAQLSQLISPSSSETECKMGLAILYEQFYVSEELVGSQMLEKAWSFIQEPGDAVFIPPGCPHQVTNIGNCIKIATDFICPSDIESLRLLGNMFRAINIHYEGLVHNDIVNLEMTLWFAWRSICP